MGDAYVIKPTIFQERCIDLPWVPVSGEDFDVTEKSVLIKFDGGKRQFYINAYGELNETGHNSLTVRDSYTYLRRTLETLERARRKAYQHGVLTTVVDIALKHNIGLIKEISNNGTNMPPDAANVECIRQSGLDRQQQVLNETNVLCEEGDEASKCTYYMSPLGSIRSAAGVYSKKAFEDVLGLMAAKEYDNPPDHQLLGLLRFLRDAKKDSSIWPPL